MLVCRYQNVHAVAWRLLAVCYSIFLYNDVQLNDDAMTPYMLHQ